MATAGELTTATGIPFGQAIPERLPAGDPICRWPLVPDPPMIEANSAYVSITFRQMTLDRAKIVDGGDGTTIGGRAALVGAGDSNGVVSIDAGGGLILRLQLAFEPAVQEQHEKKVPDVIRAVAEVAASHL